LATEATLLPFFSRRNIPSNQWFIGNSKIFLISNAHTLLEQLRKEALQTTVIKLQTLFRIYWAREDLIWLRTERQEKIRLQEEARKEQERLRLEAERQRQEQERARLEAERQRQEQERRQQERLVAQKAERLEVERQRQEQRIQSEAKKVEEQPPEPAVDPEKQAQNQERARKLQELQKRKEAREAQAKLDQEAAKANVESRIPLPTVNPPSKTVEAVKNPRGDARFSWVQMDLSLLAQFDSESSRRGLERKMSANVSAIVGLDSDVTARKVAPKEVQRTQNFGMDLGSGTQQAAASTRPPQPLGRGSFRGGATGQRGSFLVPLARGTQVPQNPNPNPGLQNAASVKPTTSPTGPTLKPLSPPTPHVIPKINTAPPNQQNQAPPQDNPNPNLPQQNPNNPNQGPGAMRNSNFSPPNQPPNRPSSTNLVGQPGRGGVGLNPNKPPEGLRANPNAAPQSGTTTPRPTQQHPQNPQLGPSRPSSHQLQPGQGQRGAPDPNLPQPNQPVQNRPSSAPNPNQGFMRPNPNNQTPNRFSGPNPNGSIVNPLRGGDPNQNQLMNRPSNMNLNPNQTPSDPNFPQNRPPGSNQPGNFNPNQNNPQMMNRPSNPNLNPNPQLMRGGDPNMNQNPQMMNRPSNPNLNPNPQLMRGGDPNQNPQMMNRPSNPNLNPNPQLMRGGDPNMNQNPKQNPQMINRPSHQNLNPNPTMNPNQNPQMINRPSNQNLNPNPQLMRGGDPNQNPQMMNRPSNPNLNPNPQLMRGGDPNQLNRPSGGNPNLSAPPGMRGRGTRGMNPNFHNDPNSHFPVTGNRNPMVIQGRGGPM
jgi:hypothetical protein